MILARVLTIGSFAVPHLGHAAFLRACERFGELTVGVNSDAFIKRYKGKAPLFTQTERLTMIRALGYGVVLNDGPGRACIELVKPEIIIVGSDWAERDYLAQIDVTQAFLDDRGISIVYLPMRPIGISSSEVLRRLDSIA